MSPEVRFIRYWYSNGKEWLSRTHSWEFEENGSVCYHIFWLEGSKGFPTGNWELKLYIGSELAQSSKFKIGQ